jgi:hypothetical protein
MLDRSRIPYQSKLYNFPTTHPWVVCDVVTGEYCAYPQWGSAVAAVGSLTGCPEMGQILSHGSTRRLRL